MKPFFKTIAASALAFSFSCGPAIIAQEHHDDQEHRDQNRHGQYVRHDDWKRGEQMRHQDWDRGQRVDDYQSHHLRRPRQGYEWREVDGQYVMADQDGRIHQVVRPN